MNAQRNMTDFNITMIEAELIRLATDLQEVEIRIQKEPHNCYLQSYKDNTEARIRDLSLELNECFEYKEKRQWN
jgi:hypothetical protein